MSSFRDLSAPPRSGSARRATGGPVVPQFPIRVMDMVFDFRTAYAADLAGAVRAGAPACGGPRARTGPASSARTRRDFVKIRSFVSAGIR